MQTHHRLHPSRLLPASLIGLATLGATLAAQDPEIAALRAQIAALDQKVRVLERQREIAAEESAAKAKTTPNVTVGEKGFSLEAPDKAWSIRVRGNIQLDGRVFFDDEGNNTNDKFLLRRVRPSVEGTIAERFTFRVMPDFAPATVELLEAYGNYKFADEFNVLFGKTKSPVGLERLVSQSNLAFVERGYPTSLLPNRDTGIQLHGKLLEQRLDWNVSVLNGTADGANGPASAPDDNYELAARLFAHPLRGSGNDLLENIGLGVSGTAGTQENSSPSGYRTTAQTGVFSWNSNVRNAGQVTRLSPQAYWYHGPLGVLGEYAISRQELRRTDTGAEATLTNTGWQVYFTYVLTGEDASYAGVRPEKPFSLANGTWGAWEVAYRIGQLAIDDDAFPAFASATSSVRQIDGQTLGLTWYWNRNFKLNLNYDWNTFAGGAATGDRDDEHALFSRFQLQF